MPEKAKPGAKRGPKPGSLGHDPWAKVRSERDEWRERAERMEAAFLTLLQDIDAAVDRARKTVLPEAKD
jgi:hypothetical protein